MNKRLCLNLACGKGIRASDVESDWVNVDRVANEGVDFQYDLFRMPYPWQDNSVDEVYCGHFVEHLPHDLRPYNSRPWPWEQQKRHLLSIDGFFAFFEEVWRICKPMATVKIVTPFGMTTRSMQDPTHTRSIVPATFSYLHPNAAEDDTPFDYQLRCNFAPLTRESVQIEFAGPMYPGREEVYQDAYNQLRFLWNIAENMIVEMAAIK